MKNLFHRACSGLLVRCLMAWGFLVASGSVAADEEILVPIGAEWSYQKGTEPPGAVWMHPSFNDSGWLKGLTPIGYGYPNLATNLDDMENGYLTIFTRKVFNVTNPASISSSFLRASYDDGLVFYVNNTEVERVNVLPGDDTETTPAASASTEPATVIIPIPDGLLQLGANLIAVSVHNVLVTSSDLLFLPEVVVLGPSDAGLTAFGFQHAASGAAQLEKTPTGGVKITGLTGLGDKVTVDLNGAKGFDFHVEDFTAVPGAHFDLELARYVNPSGTDVIFGIAKIEDLGNGKGQVIFNSPGVTGYTVLVLKKGIVVSVLPDVPAGQPIRWSSGDNLVGAGDGHGGDSKPIPGIAVVIKTNGLVVSLPGPGSFEINDAGAIVGDAVAFYTILLQADTDGDGIATDASITGSGVSNLTIGAEAAAYDTLAPQPAWFSAEDKATVTNTEGGVELAMASAPEPARFVISSEGSKFTGNGSEAVEVSFQMTLASAPDDSYIGIGPIPPNHVGGGVHQTKKNGNIELTVDLAGATTYTVTLRNAGVVVATKTVVGPHVAQMQEAFETIAFSQVELPAAGDGGGAALDTVRALIRHQSFPVDVDLDGEIFLVDEIDFTPENAILAPGSVQNLRVETQGLGSVTVMAAKFTPAKTIANGLPHKTIRKAKLYANLENELVIFCPTPCPDSGASVDLGEAQGYSAELPEFGVGGEVHYDVQGWSMGVLVPGVADLTLKKKEADGGKTSFQTSVNAEKKINLAVYDGSSAVYTGSTNSELLCTAEKTARNIAVTAEKSAVAFTVLLESRGSIAIADAGKSTVMGDKLVLNAVTDDGAVDFIQSVDMVMVSPGKDGSSSQQLEEALLFGDVRLVGLGGATIKATEGAIVLDKIGPTGKDGVEVKKKGEEIKLKFNPPTENPPDAALKVTALFGKKDDPDAAPKKGEAEQKKKEGVGYALTADWSGISGSTVLVQVRAGGNLLVEVLIGTAIGSVSAWPIGVSASDPWEFPSDPRCQRFLYAPGTTFTIDGVMHTGDELVIGAGAGGGGAGISTGFVAALELRATSTGPITLTGASVVELPTGGRQIPSDANQSGILDLSDAIWLLNHLFLGSNPVLPCDGGTASNPGPGALKLLNANGDSAGIDLSDAVSILSYLFTGGAPIFLGADCIEIEGCPTVAVCGNG